MDTMIFFEFSLQVNENERNKITKSTEKHP